MKLGYLLFVIALFSASPFTALAQSQVSLLPGWQAEDGTRYAGVRITLEPGWKTYWRSPEGNGIPPQFDWTGSQNLVNARIHWPEPLVFTNFGLRSIGYENQVIFPVEMTPKDPNAPIDVRLGLFYGVCEAVCIPAEAGISAAFAPGQEVAAQDIRLALASRPRTASEAGIMTHSCRIRPQDEGYAVTAKLSTSAPLNADFAVFETGNEDLWISMKAIQSHADGLTISAQMDYYGSGAFAFDRSALRLTLFGPQGAVEVRGCPAA